MSKTTAEVLKKARKRLIEHGWCKGAYERGEKCCAAGAVHKVLQGQEPTLDLSAISALNRTAARITGDPTMSIVKYNDQRGRKKADVLALFTSAIRSENSRKD